MQAAFLRLVGPRLIHITPRENHNSILSRGLLPAAELARADGQDPDLIRLRADRVKLPCGARLTHQRPILHARRAACAMLDGRAGSRPADAHNGLRSHCPRAPRLPPLSLRGSGWSLIEQCPPLPWCR